MHMPDGLAGVASGIEDDSVSAVFDALGGGDLACLADELVQQSATRAGQRRDVRKVIPGDHEDVRRRLRVDVTKGDDPLPVQHNRGRDLSGGDPAEQAVWHTTIIVGTGGRRCRTRHCAACSHRVVVPVPAGLPVSLPSRPYQRSASYVPGPLAKIRLAAAYYSPVVPATRREVWITFPYVMSNARQDG